MRWPFVWPGASYGKRTNELREASPSFLFLGHPQPRREPGGVSVTWARVLIRPLGRYGRHRRRLLGLGGRCVSRHRGDGASAAMVA